MIISRRSFFSLLAAPAIIKTVGLLMPVKSFLMPPELEIDALFWALGPKNGEMGSGAQAIYHKGIWRTVKGDKPIVLTIDPHTQCTGFRYA